MNRRIVLIVLLGIVTILGVFAVLMTTFAEQRTDLSFNVPNSAFEGKVEGGTRLYFNYNIFPIPTPRRVQIEFQWMRGVQDGSGRVTSVVPYGKPFLYQAPQEMGINQAHYVSSELLPDLRAYVDQLAQEEFPDDVIRMRIRLDPNNGVRETNERNNELQFGRPRPDFVLADPAPAFTNGRSPLVFKIRNTGRGSSYGKVSVGLQWLDQNGNGIGDPVEWPVRTFNDQKEFPARGARKFESNEESAFFVAYLFRNIPPEARSLRLTADLSNTIKESNENNNVVKIGRPLPNLKIRSAVFSNANVLDVRVENTGPVPSDPYNLTFWYRNGSEPLGQPVTVPGGPPRGLAPNEVRRFLSTDQRGVSRYLQNERPVLATQLEVTANMTGAVADADKSDNTVLVTLPYGRPKPR
ncbi:MAG: hypothetical protein G01um1014106_386 [Parcubacteria group bacterium Gr01-1014_106]|nr:MAG: hypothetical protein G01um1014106_386 [Parcubacteria group bacterium Gr01-1014_106]